MTFGEFLEQVDQGYRRAHGSVACPFIVWANNPKISTSLMTYLHHAYESHRACRTGFPAIIRGVYDRIANPELPENPWQNDPNATINSELLKGNQ